MITATKIRKVKAYLTVLGLQPNSTKNNFELWEDYNRKVVICVSEDEMPALSIVVMLKDLNEGPEDFVRITSVIN